MGMTMSKVPKLDVTSQETEVVDEDIIEKTKTTEDIIGKKVVEEEFVENTTKVDTTFFKNSQRSQSATSRSELNPFLLVKIIILVTWLV